MLNADCLSFQSIYLSYFTFFFPLDIIIIIALINLFTATLNVGLSVCVFA